MTFLACPRSHGCAAVCFTGLPEPRRRAARHLSVSLRTLQRYAASGNAPRAVYLAPCSRIAGALGPVSAGGNSAVFNAF